MSRLRIGLLFVAPCLAAIEVRCVSSTQHYKVGLDSSIQIAGCDLLLDNSHRAFELEGTSYLPAPVGLWMIRPMHSFSAS